MVETAGHQRVRPPVERGGERARLRGRAPGVGIGPHRRTRRGDGRGALAVDAAGARRWSRRGSFAPVVVDGPLAFVAATTSTRSDIFAVDSAGHVVWSAAPGGFVSALAADPEQHTLYVASLLQLTGGPSIQLLTGYAEADGLLRSAVVLPIPSFVSVSSLGFAKGLVFGTQSNDHGEGGIGAFAVHPDTGALAWSA